MAAPQEIPIISIPQPTFTVSNLTSDGTHFVLYSSSTFPENFPRENYALFVRVNRINEFSNLIPQANPDPSTANVFTVEIPEDGVYEIRLLAFTAEEFPVFFGRKEGDIVYDLTKETLVRLTENGASRKWEPIAITDVDYKHLPYSSPTLVYLQIQPGKDRRSEVLAKVLDLQMQGKKQLNKNKIKELSDEIRDYDLAISGIKEEFDAGRYTEAQRIITLLDKLRIDSCSC